MARIAVDEYGFGNVMAGTWCPEGEEAISNCPVGSYCPDTVSSSLLMSLLFTRLFVYPLLNQYVYNIENED